MQVRKCCYVEIRRAISYQSTAMSATVRESIMLFCHPISHSVRPVQRVISVSSTRHGTGQGAFVARTIRCFFRSLCVHTHLFICSLSKLVRTLKKTIIYFTLQSDHVLRDITNYARLQTIERVGVPYQNLIINLGTGTRTTQEQSHL